MPEQLKDCVLLVDDDFNVSRIHARMLTRAGVDLIVSTSAEHALNVLKTEQIGAIVSDLKMPGIDGIEFMRAVRKVDQDMPVIVVTAYPSFETAASSIELGVFRYLTKPVQAHDLVEAVSFAFSMHRLARAKRRGLELYHNERSHVADRMSLEASFERALEQLWIAFQPIVNCLERETIGYEALVRSREATLPMPDVLLSAAERLGRLRDLGQLVRSRVVQAIEASSNQTRIFVNVDASDLTDDSLYAIKSPFSQHADRIVLEVTERSSLDRIPDVSNRIKALRQLGFKIALDDFGAGYAGLSSFGLLNPDIAKVDMSLVRGIESSPQKQSIVRSMLQVCQKELGVDVVCEGVETTAERDALKALGSNCQQGFLFGHPMAAFELPSWAER
jgi:EAL domain-containing protein (putative c-di-GMP-specific phosphodiesterase class I)/FixJ family two-component response regulator